MADYAVINPATGETVREYPTIGDDELRDAIARADQAHTDWGTSSVEERAAPIRRVGEIHTEQRAGARRDHRPRDGQADRAGARRGRLLRRHLRVLRRQRRGAAGRRADQAARGRRLGADPAQLARRAAGDHAVELPLLPGGALRRARTWWSATRSCSSTLRSAPSRPRRWSRCSTTPGSPRAPTSTSTPPTSRSPRSSPTRACRASR